MRAGEVDIALSGIMRSLDLADRGEPYPVHFAEVCSRNGFFLLSREPRPRFSWLDLRGPHRDRLRGGAHALAVPAHRAAQKRRGPCDGATSSARAPRPRPSRRSAPATATSSSRRSPWSRSSWKRAPRTSSRRWARPPARCRSPRTWPRAEFLRREPDVVARFTRAVLRTQRWLATAAARRRGGGHRRPLPGDRRAPRASASSPATSARARGRAIRSCAAPGYEYLQDILVNGAFIRRRHRYEDLIDTAFAEAAMRAA